MSASETGLQLEVPPAEARESRPGPRPRQFNIIRDKAQRALEIKQFAKEIEALTRKYRRKLGFEVAQVVIDVEADTRKLHQSFVLTTPNLRWLLLRLAIHNMTQLQMVSSQAYLLLLPGRLLNTKSCAQVTYHWRLRFKGRSCERSQAGVASQVAAANHRQGQQHFSLRDVTVRATQACKAPVDPGNAKAAANASFQPTAFP